jgi:hydroxyethylthiazole kinase-like uncharacterized protein yjeF
MSGETEVTLGTLSDFPLPPLIGVGDKEGRGRVLAIGGGARVPGALILTGLAALRAGAGKLQLATARAGALALGVAVPEAAVLAVAETEEGEIAPEAADTLADAVAKTDAVVIGPGMMDEASAGALAGRLAATSDEAGFVLDAAAMTGLNLSGQAVRRLAGRLILTPHAGEMARLTGLEKTAIEDDPLAAARWVARTAQAVVVMKGAETFIVSPDGRAWRHPSGVVGLATSGSGDVLAGVVAGLLARGAAPLVAAIWGVCVHGGCGARLAETVGPVGFLARELLPEIPRIMAEAGGA